jgi:hypothetical protein
MSFLRSLFTLETIQSNRMREDSFEKKSKFSNNERRVSVHQHLSPCHEGHGKKS